MSEPKLTEITLPILGMNCNGCASNVERAIGKLPGVSAVKVDLKTNAAKVTYDPQNPFAAAHGIYSEAGTGLKTNINLRWKIKSSTLTLTSTTY